MLAPWKSCDKPRQCIKKRRHHFADKDPYSQSFSRSHVWMWELDRKEGWAPKNWCFQTVVLEKTLEGPLDSKEIQPVSPKGDQSWVLIGRTDAEAEASNTLATGFEEPTHWKRPWCWEWLRARGERGSREYHHWLNGHEFEQAQGDSVGQGSLTCYSSRGHKELDVT